jgi:hypothetical protein
MPTTYTSLIGLAKPQTGELAGTWGDVVNDYLTTYVDAAVAGSQVISGSQTSVDLTVANGTALVQVAGTSSGSAQYRIIRCTGNPAGTLTITAPADSRAYVVVNATSTNQSVVVRGSGPTTGVTIAALTRALIAWNGSDYALVASNRITDLTGTLSTGNGGTGLTSFTSGTAVYATSTSALTTGTLPTTGGGTGLTSFTSGGAVYATSTSALTTGTLPVASGGTGAASLTANNVILGNGTSAVQVVAPSTTGNVLTSNGTTWTSAAPPGFRADVFTSGTSQTWSVPSGVGRVKITIIGGGGGGGGMRTVGCVSVNGHGGGAGGIAIVYLNVSAGGNVTYTVGTGGSGGAADAGGGSGTQTTATYSATTYTASGGTGGPSTTTPTALTAGGVGTNGTINLSGGSGQMPSLYAVPGGSTPFGFGGGSSGYGTGGNGGSGVSASTAGKGGIIIFEY